CVRRDGLEQRWASERTLVDELLLLRGKLREGLAPVEGTGSPLEAAAEAEADAVADAADVPAAVEGDHRDALRARLRVVQAELADLQGESPLLLPTVDYQAVASVVADRPGLPDGGRALNA